MIRSLKYTSDIYYARWKVHDNIRFAQEKYLLAALAEWSIELARNDWNALNKITALSRMKPKESQHNHFVGHETRSAATALSRGGWRKCATNIFSKIGQTSENFCWYLLSTEYWLDKQAKISVDICFNRILTWQTSENAAVDICFQQIFKRRRPRRRARWRRTKKGQVDGESVRKKLEQSKNSGTSKWGRSWSQARWKVASRHECHVRG